MRRGRWEWVRRRKGKGEWGKGEGDGGESGEEVRLTKNHALIEIGMFFQRRGIIFNKI